MRKSRPGKMNHREHRESDAGFETSMATDAFVDEIDEPNPELNRITNQIIAAAIAVHRELGPGFLESVYERAMCIELARRGVQFIQQYVFSVAYQNEVVGEGRVDLLVENSFVVELKAVEKITPIHRAVAISYLKATGKKLCIILNFHERVLKDGIVQIAC